MKKVLKFFASLILGLMIASCQSDLEEVVDLSAVQDELASTRAEEDSTNEIGTAELLAAELRAADVDLRISGSLIISGTNEVTYTASYAGSFYVDWDYNTSVLSKTAGGDGLNSKTIKLKLVSASNTSDTYVRVYLKSSSSGDILYATTIYVGCNGPLANTSSLGVVRSSDGVEVYPAYVGLSPNTWYYAYLTNTQASNMTLQWVFSNGFDNANNATIYDQYGYTVYFKTSSYGWTFLTVNGKMPGSSVYKYLLGVTLYDEINPNSIIEEESEE